MVYITGDCHANYHKFSVDNFPDQKEMSRGDLVIVCGDFGLWHPDEGEAMRFEALSELPFTIVFVDGNHENFDRLYSDEFPIVDFCGGKAHKILENVYHLMRGYIFEFDGKSFFAFGGASSHDIYDGILDADDFKTKEEFYLTVERWSRWNRMFRINHMSWWEQEMPSQEEMQFGLATLEKHGNKVDYIISHCAPQEIVSIALGYGDSDELTRYFNLIAHTVDFDKWYFGHYHDEKTIMSKFNMLYHKIERVI